MVVACGVTIVGVVEAGEIGRDADRIPSSGDVVEDARIPDAFFTFAV